MNLWRRPLPWWATGAIAVVGVGLVLLQVSLRGSIPSVVVVLTAAVLFVVIEHALAASSRRRLERELGSDDVFTVDYDRGSQIVLDDLASEVLPETSALLAVRPGSLQFWTTTRDPSVQGVVELSALAGAVVSWRRGPRVVGTVEIALPDGRAVFLDVKRSLFERAVGLRGDAEDLAGLIEARLSAQPDTARTQPPAQSD